MTIVAMAATAPATLATAEILSAGLSIREVSDECIGTARHSPTGKTC